MSASSEAEYRRRYRALVALLKKRVWERIQRLDVTSPDFVDQVKSIALVELTALEGTCDYAWLEAHLKLEPSGQGQKGRPARGRR